MKIKSLLTSVFALGLFMSSHAQWAVQSAPTTLAINTDMHFLNNVDGLAVGTNQSPNGNARIVRTADGGMSWTVVHNVPPSTSPTVFNFNDIFFVNNSLGYAVGGYSGPHKAIISKTTNGGITWDTLHHNIDDARILSSYFFNATDGFCSSFNIYKTTDGGITWTATNNPVGSYDDLQFINADTGYAFTQYTNELIRSIDGGANWSTVVLPTTEDVMTLHFANNLMGFAGCQNGVILKTGDGGTTWAQVTNNDPAGASVINIKFTSATTGFAGTSEGIILRSMDGGATWNVNFDLTTSPLVPIGGADCFSFPSVNVGYVAAGFFFVAKTPNGGGPVGPTGPTGPSNVAKIKGNNGFSIFPNPASSYIQLTLPFYEEGITASLRSITGGLQRKMKLKADLRIDIEKLPKGVYIVEIKNSIGVFSQRFVKM